MWMDWNDPAELRRLHDLLAHGPDRGHDHRGARTARSPTPSRCSSAGSGCPRSAARYFTFSNENNDLIWGFLAECHRRGWLYKGHDTMPWCPRCGTGLSQMEMNEGYQDREDPGLTVRFPLVDRPGRVAPRLDDDALDADLERRGRGRAEDLRYVRVRQGEDRFWLGKGTLKTRRPGAVHGRGGGRGLGARRLALRRAVRRPAGGPRRRSREAGLRAPRRRLGRGRRGRGHGHRPHRARLRRRGLPAGQGARAAGHRPDRRGRPLLRRASTG